MWLRVVEPIVVTMLPAHHHHHHDSLRSRCGLVLAVTLLLAPGTAGQEDVVFTRSGGELRGHIVSQGRDGLVLGLRHGASTRLAWDRVESIQWEAPPAFDVAEEAQADGRWEDALSALDTLRTGSDLRRPLRQEVLFRSAMIQQQLGRTADAAATFGALLDGWPDGRYRPQALRGAVEAQLDLGRADEAARVLDRTERTSDAARAAPGGRGRRNLLRGLVLMAQGRFDEAREKLDHAASDEDFDAGGRQEAALSVARILQATGDEEGAEAGYRALVVQDAPPIVLAGAWNGLADLSVARGLAHRDGEMITEALLGYLRGVVQYVPRVGERTAEHRRASLGAAHCFDLLGQLEKDPVRRADLRRREQRMRQLAEMDG